MNHLPDIRNSSCPLLEVPCIATPYDGLSFAEYPLREGWDKALFVRSDFTNNGSRTVEEAAAFLQTWLYFGTIHEVLGDVTAAYVWMNENGPMISTLDLPVHLQMWKGRVDGMDADDKQHDLQRVLSCLLEVDLLVGQFNRSGGFVDSWPLDPVISLSVLVLLETLDDARHKFYSPTAEVSVQLNLTVSHLLEQQMLDQGRCPEQISMLGLTCGPSAMYVTSRLKNFSVRDHTRCDKTICVSYQLDPLKYQSKHVEPDCRCKHLHAHLPDISELVRAGQIPIVRLQEGESDDIIEIQVARHEPMRNSYVAISHVWSDGLGNMQSNSLPHYQLTVIQTLVACLQELPTSEP